MKNRQIAATSAEIRPPFHCDYGFRVSQNRAMRARRCSWRARNPSAPANQPYTGRGFAASMRPRAASSVRSDRARSGAAAKGQALPLADRIGRATIICQARDQDRYGRIVAVCFKGGEDLNRWMVLNGWVVAYRRYLWITLLTKKRGGGPDNIWPGSFIMSEDWRVQQRGH